MAFLFSWEPAKGERRERVVPKARRKRKFNQRPGKKPHEQGPFETRVVAPALNAYISPPSSQFSGTNEKASLYYYTRFPQDEKTLVSSMWYMRTLLSWLIRAIPLVYFPPCESKGDGGGGAIRSMHGRKEKKGGLSLPLPPLPPSCLSRFRPPPLSHSRKASPSREIRGDICEVPNRSRVSNHTLTFYFRKEGGRGTEWRVGRTGGGEVGLSEQIFEED